MDHNARMDRKLPWKRPNPKIGASQPLTAEQKEAARRRAEAAGRRYPNLVDNMWASRRRRGTTQGNS